MANFATEASYNLRPSVRLSLGLVRIIIIMRMRMRRMLIIMMRMQMRIIMMEINERSVGTCRSSIYSKLVVARL